MASPWALNRELQFAWLLRRDVRDGLLQANEDEQEAQKEFVVWWLVFGRHEFSGNTWLTEDQAAVVQDVVETSQGVRVTRLMRYIVGYRQDVRQSFGEGRGWPEYARWFYLYGVPEYGLFNLLADAELEYLDTPSEHCPQDTIRPITRLMHWLWLARPDVAAAFPLDDDEGRVRFLAWFYVFGLKEHRLFGYLGPGRAAQLFMPVSTAPGDRGEITQLMYYLWRADPHASGSVDLARPEGRSALRRIANERLRGDFSPIWDVLNSRLQPGIYHGEPKAGGEGFGVNLVGYALGELGIGEDVRLMAEALEAVGMDFCLLNRQPGAGIRQLYSAAARHLSVKPRYPVTLICMTAFDTATLWLDRPDVFRNTYVIGYWPWELPEWPAEWGRVYDLVDEIWCSSQYTLGAFSNSPDLPKSTVPLSVSVALDGDYARRDFDLPEDRFLFLFAFDFMSYPARKNPQGCLAAFQRAFPAGDEAVGLVLKASNLTEGDPEWERIQAACAADPRIVVIGKNLDKPAVLGLMSVCDAYVSLHRAEGFGRTMAEAMLLEKPVIATGYSGNADFVREDTGFPVDYALADIRPGDYPGGQGQRWAEPDVAHAAELMRHVYLHPDEAKQKGRAGREFILRNNAPEVIGERVKQRLAALMATGCMKISRP
jgi:glycosyltransferase involved in cell wall biosynthesis